MDTNPKASLRQTDWPTRTIAVSAFILVVFVAAGELRSWAAPSHTDRPPPRPKPVHVANWRDLERAGERIGSANAQVVITEFADFQCPVCRRFTAAWAAAKETFKDTVALVYIHFPLDNHAQAVPAARASECAREQGQFSKFVDVAYQHQDSLGKKPWYTLAEEAGVRDSGRFNKCMSVAELPERVRAGLAQGYALDLRGTPTLLVNGWRFNGSLRAPALDSVIRRVLAGKSPG